MHGRVKVRTTEEEKERKRKEQALKVKAYRAAMAKIQTKRSARQFDGELLVLTAQVLQRNPDVSTLWNIRRECVLKMVQQLPEKPEGAVDDGDADDSGVGSGVDDGRQALYDNELHFTEQCLMVNPKSYGGWHHRCWALEHSPRPDWERELQLCNKYLKLDERNFHTWDYRRYVAAKAGVPLEQELAYCTEKIKANFSNYSSWHYRSLLLPVLHPYTGTDGRPMSERKLTEELDMVLTAAFTDPSDSSAWFYQRWLLGYSRQSLAVCAFRCDRQRAVLAFTHAVPCAGAEVALLRADGTRLAVLEAVRPLHGTGGNETAWCAAMPTGGKLQFDAATASSYRLAVNIPNVLTEELPLQCGTHGLHYFQPPNRAAACTADVRKELASQLESCQSLLEFEPDSKWTLLTSALLMRALDGGGAYHAQSLQHLEQLQAVDALRAGYYKDLASKWILEKRLADWADSAEMPQQLSLLEEPQLTALCYTQYMSIADGVALPLSLQAGAVDARLKTFGQLD